MGEYDPVGRLPLPVGRPCHDVAQLRGEQGGHRVRHVTEPDRLRIAQPAPYRTGDQRGLADGPPLGRVPGDDAAVGADGDDRGRDHRLVPERDHRDPDRAGDRSRHERRTEIDSKAVRHVAFLGGRCASVTGRS